MDGTISVSLAGRGRDIEFAARSSPADLRAAVRAAFGLTADTSFVRHANGCVMPINPVLPAGPFRAVPGGSCEYCGVRGANIEEVGATDMWPRGRAHVE